MLHVLTLSALLSVIASAVMMQSALPLLVLAALCIIGVVAVLSDRPERTL